MKIRIKYLSALTTHDMAVLTVHKQTAEVEWINGTPYQVIWL